MNPKNVYSWFWTDGRKEVDDGLTTYPGCHQWPCDPERKRQVNIMDGWMGGWTSIISDTDIYLCIIIFWLKNSVLPWLCKEIWGYQRQHLNKAMG